MIKGCKYGTHRVIEPKGVLPQPALKIDNNMEIYSNEILIDVIALNVDSASFTQIEEEAGHDVEKIKAKIKEIVGERGKMQNPVTGSGGMLIGTIEKIGDDLVGKTNLKIDNNMEIYSNEILIDVIALNVDSASFTQIEEEAGHDVEKIKAKIKEIVGERGKMQNPVTGSGGMLIGTIEKIGDDLVGKTNLKVGDKIATLVSLSLTPLRIDEILDVKPEIDRVEIKGKAILFESGIYAVLPEDMPETLALAALDVAGAPAQVAKLVRPCQSVAILGSAGKSGMLCAYEAVKRVGPTGKVIGLVRNEKEAALR